VAKKKTTRTSKAEATGPAGSGVAAPEAGADTVEDSPPRDDLPNAREDMAATADTAPESDATGEVAPETDAPDTEETGTVTADSATETTPETATEAEAEAPAAPPEADAPEDSTQPETDTAEAAPEATEPPAAPDRDTTPAPVVRTEQVTVRQGGFWSMLLGGVAAAGIGAAAAPYILPPDWFAPAPDRALEARLSEQAARLAGLEERLAAPTAPTAPTDQSGEIDGLSQTVTDLTARLAETEQRLAELAARPAPETPAATVPEEALAELTARLDSQRAEIDALRGAAEAQQAAERDSARATLRRAALVRVRTALDTGEDFSGALADLRDTGAEVPEALAAAAETGVPTRAALTESFPEAARAALAAARRETAEGAGSVTDFLRGQLGIRSLAPREGDDPDAILSRAEAALGEGRLGDALAEIETLPEGARAALADWTAAATMRHDALDAAEALSAAMN
jgi:hypothetical protein